MEATGKGLVEFLAFAAEKGMMNQNTAGSRKAAVREILSATEGEEWPQVDLTSLDVEDCVRRFQTLNPGKLVPGSLSVYASRFRQAVEDFESYRQNPSGWRFTPKRATRSARTDKGSVTNGRTQPVTEVWATPNAQTALIQYPFPLRKGLIANLTLPADLSKSEARRLGAYLESLALEEQLALPAADATSAQPASP